MSKIHFLLVDDEEEYVAALAQRLQQKGFTAEYTFSGLEALNRLAKDNSVDVVVLDVRMPGPDGIKTAEVLKKKYPLVEVIMLTGQATVHSAVESMKIGAYDYLTKPCELDDLIARAEQAVHRKREREAEILNARMKPYISKQEREELLSSILDRKK